MLLSLTPTLVSLATVSRRFTATTIWVVVVVLWSDWDPNPITHCQWQSTRPLTVTKAPSGWVMFPRVVTSNHLHAGPVFTPSLLWRQERSWSTSSHTSDMADRTRLSWSCLSVNVLFIIIILWSQYLSVSLLVHSSILSQVLFTILSSLVCVAISADLVSLWTLTLSYYSLSTFCAPHDETFTGFKPTG